MTISAILSRVGIRLRVYGGFGLILGLLSLLAMFAWAQVGQISGTVADLVVSADGDAGMAQVRTSSLIANGAVQKFIRSRNLGDRDLASKAIEQLGGTFAQIDQQFGDLPAIAAGRSGLKAALDSYRSAFDKASGAVDLVRAAAAKTDIAGAAAGLDALGIALTIANQTGPRRLLNPLSLPSAVDLARVTVMRYTATQSAFDGNDGKLALSYVEAIAAESEKEIAAAGDAHLKALLTALKAALADDSAALLDLMKSTDQLIAVQAELEKASAAISNQAVQIGQALGARRVEQSGKAGAMVAQTRNWVLSVASIALILGVLLAWIIGTSVSGPISRMTARMRSLAEGELEHAIPGGDRHDEIGQMGRAVEVFRDNAMAVRRMEQEAAAQRAAAEAERGVMMVDLADRFDRGMEGVITGVTGRSEQMGQSAQTLAKVAERGRGLAESVAARSEQASTNVETVAAATHQLAASISEISQQATRSVTVSRNAQAEATQTTELMRCLSNGAEKIGAVVQLIQAIATQTNLLALNATIEAARAGDAGRGFAVVASEVKTLATQTAKATEEISGQIAEIQNATSQSVAAIERIGATIGEITEIAAAIASAVEQQGAATREIARNVEEATKGTTAVTQQIGDVRAVAGETDAGAEAALAVASALQDQAKALQSNVADFLQTVRSAARAA